MNWKFIIHSTPGAWGSIVLMVNNEEGGYIFDKKGVSSDNINPSFKYGFSKESLDNGSRKEITLKQALKLIDSPYREKFCKFLKIEMPDMAPTQVDEKSKTLILTTLNIYRAFNPDSALCLREPDYLRDNINGKDFKIKDLQGSLESMVEQKLIKVVKNNKFYIDK